MSIGKRIQEARKKAGYTQKELAEKCGVATGTIQQYELGKRQPKIEQLIRIAKHLNVPLFTIISKEDYAEMKETEQAYFQSVKAELDADYIERGFDDFISKGYTPRPDLILLNRFRKLNEIGQEKAIEHIDMLAKIPEYQIENAVQTIAKAVQDGHIQIRKKDEE